MELKDLFARKGEIVTQLEMLQAQLQEVNKALAVELNKPQSTPEVKTETPKAE